MVGAGFVVALLSAAGALATVPADARNQPSESDLVTRVNQERTSRGLGALAIADDLVAVARHHSQDMADHQRLFHNPNLGTEVHGWQTVGENVGTGPSETDVHRAFMGSTVHRDDILSPEFTQIGVGVVWDGNRIWVTEIYRQPEVPRPAAQPAAPRAVQQAPARAAAAPASRPPRPSPPVRAAGPVPVVAAVPPTAAPTTVAAATPSAAARAEVAAERVGSGLVTEVAGVVRTQARPVAMSVPVPVRVPAPAGVAAALLSLVVACQGAAFRRLGLV